MCSQEFKSLEMLSPESAHGMLPSTPDPVAPSEPWAPTVVVASSGAATPPFPDRYVGDGPLPELNPGISAKLSADAVATIAKRLAAATSGPWNRVAEVDDSNLADSVYSDGWKGLLIARCNQNGEHGADSELIANAPSDIAFLLSELATARREIDKLKADAQSSALVRDRFAYESSQIDAALGLEGRSFGTDFAIEMVRSLRESVNRLVDIQAENARLRVELATERSACKTLKSDCQLVYDRSLAAERSLEGYRHALAAALTLVSAEQTRFDAAEALADRMRRLNGELADRRLHSVVSSVNQVQEVPSL